MFSLFTPRFSLPLTLYRNKTIKVLFPHRAEMSFGFSYLQTLKCINLFIFVTFFAISVSGLRVFWSGNKTWVKDTFIQYGGFLFFFLLHWLNNLNDLPSSSQIISSAWPSLLLKLSTEFFRSGTVFFRCGISICVIGFWQFPFLHWTHFVPALFS